MKKLVCFLFIFLFFSFPVSGKEVYKPVSELTYDEIETYALNFVELLAVGDMSVSDVVPITDVSGMVLGCSVSYEKDGAPYGYLNLDFQYENPVREFCIESGVPGYYESVLSQTEAVSQSEPVLIFAAPGQLAVPDGDGLVDLYGRRVDPSGLVDARKTVYAHISDLFLKSFDAEGGTVEKKYIKAYDPDLSIITQPEIISLTGKYACAPLALTEIMSQNGFLLDGSISDTFLRLWDLTGTETEYLRDLDGYTDVECGSTDDSMVPSAIRLYADLVDADVSYSRTSSPKARYFKNVVDMDYSGLYLLRVYQETEDGGNETVGHAVSVVGYETVTGSDGDETIYIAVADGWHDEVPVYLNIDEIVPGYPSPRGYLIYIR